MSEQVDTVAVPVDLLRWLVELAEIAIDFSVPGDYTDEDDERLARAQALVPDQGED